MKKRNIFVSLIFALLMCFSLGFSVTKNTESAHADSQEITITFNAIWGSCDTKTTTIQSGETLPSIPTAKYAGHLFLYWEYNSQEVTESTIFTEDATLTAKYVEKTNTYTISKPASEYEISAKTKDDNVIYNLNNTSSIQDAITLISEDLSDALKSNIPTIIFNDVEFTEDLHLSFKKLRLSGLVNQAGFSIYYTPPENDSYFYLTDIYLSSNANQDSITIGGEYSSTISVYNSTFMAHGSSGNYAIKLENGLHSLMFSGEISYLTQYLYNHVSPAQPPAYYAETYTLMYPSELAITIPYSVDNQTIANSATRRDLSITVYPTQSNYTCSTYTSNYDTVAKTYFNIIFDENGGTVVNNFISNDISYKPSSTLNFPTIDFFENTHHYISGYVAKISHDSKTWYFDKTAFETFLSADTDKSYLNGNWDLSNVSTCFSETLPTSILSGFEYYKYDSKSTDLNYLVVKFMLDLNVTPEFVAVWDDILYTISFNSMGGTSVNDINGILGTMITFTQTPTKTGYTFMGWFKTFDEANNYESYTPVTQATIAEITPTFYAGWELNTFNISIDPRNGNNPLDLTVNYGSNLKDILDANTDLTVYNGYEFLGWFNSADQDQEIDENTIIVEDLSIFAKWEIKQFTITLIINHPSNPEGIFDEITLDYNTNLGSFFDSEPSIIGFKFEYWCKQSNGQDPIIKANLPTTMPSENLTLYARWSTLQYRLILHYDAVHYSKDEYVFFGDDLPITTPEYSGFIFNGWFEDSNFETPLSFSIMPHDPSGNGIHIYAKFTEKKEITISANMQSYEQSDPKNFEFSSELDGFIVEYFVDNNWTTNIPTKQGSYDVRIIRAEDSEYKLFIKTFEKAFTLTANSFDLSIYILILYCVAGLELICALIILFIRKQRKTYLNYSILLPFGLVSNTQFINLVISATLALFGFVLIIAQTVKLKKINNEIANISIENKEYTPPDVSENDSISKNVDELLNREGLLDESYKASRKPKKVEIGYFDDDLDDDYTSKDSSIDDDFVSDEIPDDEQFLDDEDKDQDE